MFSIIIHEISHGFTAFFFGDRTAQYEGRLTLNPIKHLDLFGSIILPLILFVTKANFMIGWAKPVPYNPYNLKNRNVAEPLIAFAGPLSNFFVAIIFSLIIRGILYFNFSVSSSLIEIFNYVILINISLAIFNLLPVPPLDGSKIFFSLLPSNLRDRFFDMSEKYGLIIIILVIIIFPNIIYPIIFSLFKVLQ